MINLVPFDLLSLEILPDLIASLDSSCPKPFKLRTDKRKFSLNLDNGLFILREYFGRAQLEIIKKMDLGVVLSICEYSKPYNIWNDEWIITRCSVYSYDKKHCI